MKKAKKNKSPCTKIGKRRGQFRVNAAKKGTRGEGSRQRKGNMTEAGEEVTKPEGEKGKTRKKQGGEENLGIRSEKIAGML